jgi:DNA-3-methyladenine glycosylase II
VQPTPTYPDAAAIAAARLVLAARDPLMAKAHAALPELPWRARPGGYAGLMRLITAQQVSVASAAAIWARLEAGLGEVSAEAVLARDEAALKGFGLSTPKARYALAIARAHADGLVDLTALPADDEAAIAALVSLKGVGRWTAEVYLLFCEGRPDAFPAGDLAMQEALRALDDAPARLDEKAFYARAELWRPYRGVAAHLLWAYYAKLRRREGVLAAQTPIPTTPVIADEAG